MDEAPKPFSETSQPPTPHTPPSIPPVTPPPITPPPVKTEFSHQIPPSLPSEGENKNPAGIGKGEEPYSSLLGSCRGPNSGAGPTASEKQWAVALHLSALLGLLIPFFNMFAPLIIWLLKRPESSWLDAEGKRVLNFQISYTIYALIAALCTFFLFGYLLLPVIGIAYLIFLITGAIRASEGVPYHFPFTIKFFK